MEGELFLWPEEVQAWPAGATIFITSGRLPCAHPPAVLQVRGQESALYLGEGEAEA